MKHAMNSTVWFVLLGMLFSQAGCSRGESDVIIMKIDPSSAAEEPGALALQKFADRVNERSGGRIRAILYPSNSLGMNRDVTEGLQLGTIEVQMASNSPLALFVPEVNIFELPFLFESNEHMYAVLDSHIGQSFVPALEEQGFHLLGYFTFGVRHIMTTEKTINSMEDLKGLKIRTMESPPHLAAFKAFGASPLPMAYDELFVALQTGMIDGAEAANSNYYSKRFFEVADNWTQIGWLRLVAPVLMSKKFYDGLDADLQIIVDESLRELIDYERDLYTSIDEQRLKQLIDAGVKVTTPDRASFFKARDQVYEEWADKVGGREKIDEIINFPYK